jgi:hypothetical protein
VAAGEQRAARVGFDRVPAQLRDADRAAKALHLEREEVQAARLRALGARARQELQAQAHAQGRRAGTQASRERLAQARALDLLGRRAEGAHAGQHEEGSALDPLRGGTDVHACALSLERREHAGQVGRARAHDPHLGIDPHRLPLVLGTPDEPSCSTAARSASAVAL